MSAMDKFLYKPVVEENDEEVEVLLLERRDLNNSKSLRSYLVFYFRISCGGLKTKIISCLVLLWKMHSMVKDRILMLKNFMQS
ncbi:unnamed protein product [Cuscuta campestris]|uniref:Uncharacterized protein n=1 Tax=Cuscuta campestris TaxID=132261 RepID=A0A484KYV1_9ASTE|nr:unnamed protein product [Cuscuta campestris]